VSLSPPPTSYFSAVPTIHGSLLNEHQVAASLGLSVKTLRTWRWRGNGPQFLKVGRLVRYRSSDILAWQERQLRTSTSDKGSGHE
jgi:predicted DNA-binding transcriptional regulator AlpA